MSGVGRYVTAAAVACAGLAALPRVYLALVALRQFGGHVPSGLMFVDLEPVPWIRVAFLVAHVAAGWCFWLVRKRQAGPAVKVMGRLLLLELGMVYLITGFLWWRGIPLDLY